MPFTHSNSATDVWTSLDMAYFTRNLVDIPSPLESCTRAKEGGMRLLNIYRLEVLDMRFKST